MISDRIRLFILIGVLLLFGCSTPRETVMPFRNMGYVAETIFPIQNSNQEWTFRAWINNGTSVDRIITVTRDSLWGNESCLIELGTLHKKRLFGKRPKLKRINNVYRMQPKSGYDQFFKTINSLELENYNAQDNFGYYLDHQPFSLYIIELKTEGQYYQFSFNTYFPVSLIDTTRKVDEKYEIIEKLLFDEFEYEFHMK